MSTTQRLDEIVDNDILLKEIDVFLDQRKDIAESNNRIENKGSALEMAISGSLLMEKIKERM